MRHRKRTVKLGRPSQHRELMLANLVSDLINHNKVETTLARAKAMRPIAERMVTLGKKASLHHRRQAVAKLRQKDAVKKLFADLAPKYADRSGGYTRITKLGPRNSDAAPMAIIEWVEAEFSPKPKKEKAKPEAKKESKPAAKEEKPEEPKAEAPAEEPKAEAPAEEKAEAPKEEAKSEPKADEAKEEDKK